MAWQLIFTSAPRGLAMGRSGFCTVARHAAIRDMLVSEIERHSSYHHLHEAGSGQNPVISSHRILSIRGERYHLLSTIRDCGLDYTNRTNHIAHHLVCTAAEIERAPSPAAILAHWQGWLTSWQDDPRNLSDEEIVDLSTIPASPRAPATHWQQATGNPAHAALLADDKSLSGCYLGTHPTHEAILLPLFEESLRLIAPDGEPLSLSWQIPFTTFLQQTDSTGDFRWRGTWAASLPHGRTNDPVFDLTSPSSLPVPSGLLAECAATGQSPPKHPALQPKTKTQAVANNTARTSITPKAKPARSASAPPVTQTAPKEQAQADAQPSTQPKTPPPSRSNLPVILAGIVVLLIAGGAGGYLVATLLAPSPPEPPSPPSESPTVYTPPKPEIKEAPSTLPTQEPETPSQPSQPHPPPAPNEGQNPEVTVLAQKDNPSQPKSPDPAPVVEKPDPSGLDGFLANGLPKRTTYVFFGDLGSTGISTSDTGTPARFTESFRLLDAARFWRNPSSIAPDSATETITQKLPGSDTLTPGTFYDVNTDQVLLLSFHPDGITFRSPLQGVSSVALSADLEKSPFQVALMPASLTTPLIKAPSDWLSTSKNDGNFVIALKEAQWEGLENTVKLPQLGTTISGRWVLRSSGRPGEATVAPSATTPAMILPPSPEKLAKLKERSGLQKKIAETQLEVLSLEQAAKAHAMLFDPESSLHNAGGILLKWTIDNADKVIQEIDSTRKKKDLRTGATTDAQRGASYFAGRLKKRFPSFTTYLGDSFNKADVTRTEYREYLQAVMQEAEIYQDEFLGAVRAELEAYQWDQVAAKLPTRTPHQKAFADAWKQLFPGENWTNLQPLLQWKGSIGDSAKKASTLKAGLPSLQTDLKTLSLEIQNWPDSLADAGTLTLEWIPDQKELAPIPCVRFEPAAPISP